MHSSLFYEARHREYLPGLHTLVRVFLGVIANDWKFEVLTLESVDQKHNVAYYANNAYSKPDQASKEAQERDTERTDNAQYNSYNCQATKEQNRLHRMETHKAILLLHKEENEARYPGQNIAQTCFDIGLHTHRCRT